MSSYIATGNPKCDCGTVFPKAKLINQKKKKKTFQMHCIVAEV